MSSTNIDCPQLTDKENIQKVQQKREKVVQGYDYYNKSNALAEILQHEDRKDIQLDVDTRLYLRKRTMKLKSVQNTTFQLFAC